MIAAVEAIAMLTKMPGESEVLRAGIDLPVTINLNDKGGVVFSTIRSLQGHGQPIYFSAYHVWDVKCAATGKTVDLDSVISLMVET